MRMWIAILILVTLVVGAVVAIFPSWTHGFSAREEPTALEAFMARRMRRHALPPGAREIRNPLPATSEVLAQGRAHFADHCALCHGNDGRGQTTMGRSLYPKAPDMGSEGTQSLSDGEIFYIIKNGIRLTGMPAWGEETPEDDRESWALVQFIRHLPRITSEEVQEMAEANPRTRKEFEDDEEARRFLEVH
ncbi:MAG: c-type cytochrome [Acidobacteria bacterium]|nr:c-type cytochrome [Acidobacteriota bacterium]